MFDAPAMDGPPPRNRRQQLLQLASVAASVLRVSAVVTAIALLVAFAAFSFGPRLFGYETRAIVSGSMTPAIPTGSAIFVKPASPAAIAPGDIIVFRTAERAESVVHRVVAIHDGGGGLAFTTRGDANREDDPWTVAAEDLEGVVVWHLPYGGYVAIGAQSGRDSGLLLLLCGLAIVAMEVPIWYRFVRYGAAAFGPAGPPPPRSAHRRSWFLVRRLAVPGLARRREGP